MAGREAWNNNSSDRIKHELLNKRLLGYAVTLRPDQIDMSRKPELMNQFVFFLELAMGDQNQEDYLRIAQLVKPAGLISRDLLRGIFQSLMISEKLESDFMRVWENQV